MGQPRTHSQGNIPFSWERKPGVPKVTTAESFRREHKFVHKLQPPPYTSNFQRNSVDVFQIPLPPCAFQPPNYETIKNAPRVRKVLTGTASYKLTLAWRRLKRG